MLHECKEDTQIEGSPTRVRPKSQGKTSSRSSSVLLRAVIFSVLVAMFVISIFLIVTNHNTNPFARSVSVSEIGEALKFRFDGTVVNTWGDGNCLVNALCIYRDGKQSEECARSERKVVVDHTVRNLKFFSSDKTGNEGKGKSHWEKYRVNGEFLDDSHVYAWHQERKVNVLLFQDVPGTDRIRISKFWNKAYAKKPPCGLLHKGVHYWYVRLPTDSNAVSNQPYFDTNRYGYFSVLEAINESKKETVNKVTDDATKAGNAKVADMPAKVPGDARGRSSWREFSRQIWDAMIPSFMRSK